MKTTAKELFYQIHELGYGSHYSCDVCLMSDELDPDKRYRVYHKQGYCFEIEKQQHCEPDEIEDSNIDGLQLDGCTYHFDDMSWNFDGFKNCDLKSIPVII